MSEGGRGQKTTQPLRGNDAVVVDIADWVKRAQADPQTYLERQATEVFLAALGLAPSYNDRVFLKGGILMGIRYHSPRQTADLDFTADLDPSEMGDIRAELDTAMRRAAAILGYTDLICRVQTMRHRPSKRRFAGASFPALEVKIAYALRGSPQEGALHAGRCNTLLEADISFREPVDEIQIVRLGHDGPEIAAYSLTDLIAEKLRALLQQPIRNRYRRQDVYDLAHLIETFSFGQDELRHLLEVFFAKCRSRDIEPSSGSLSDPEVIRRAKSEWNTLDLELGELPDFDERFGIVERFYRSLPWE